MQVLVLDKANFYNGKVGTVLKSTFVGVVEVFWVKVGNVEFAVRKENVEVLEDS